MYTETEPWKKLLNPRIFNEPHTEFGIKELVDRLKKKFKEPQAREQGYPDERDYIEKRMEVNYAELACAAGTLRDNLRKKNNSYYLEFLTNIKDNPEDLLNQFRDIRNRLNQGTNKVSGSAKRTSKRQNDKVSVTMTGDNSQFNMASGRAKQTVTQNNSKDFDILHKLLTDIRNAVTEAMSSEDAKSVSDSLEKIENEFKQETPHTGFLNTVLTGLRAVKGTTEFGAAVSVLTKFVMESLR